MEQDYHTEPNNSASDAQADPRMARLENRLMEAFDELWDNFVDPAEAYYDVDGSRWSQVGNPSKALGAVGVAFSTEQQLAEIRAQCRTLAVGNEFAINGHENRISYIVGSGHAYRVTGKPGRARSSPLEM